MPIGSIVYRDANGNIVKPDRAALATHLMERHGLTGMTETSADKLERYHEALEPEAMEHRVDKNGKLHHFVVISAREATQRLREIEARHMGAGTMQRDPDTYVTGPNRTGAGTMTRRAR